MKNYLQAIQKAVFYKKNVHEICKRNINMLLDLQESSGQKKIKSNTKTDCWLKFFIHWLGVASESANDFNQNHSIGTF